MENPPSLQISSNRFPPRLSIATFLFAGEPPSAESSCRQDVVQQNVALRKALRQLEARPGRWDGPGTMPNDAQRCVERPADVLNF